MMLKSIEQKVLKFILDKNLISENDRVLIALSGGPDSVFLLEFLLKYKRRFKIELAAFHLNHKLRGKEADKDEKFCKEFVAAKKIPFFSAVKNVKLFARRKRISIEEAGRELRYNEVNKIAKRNGYTKIATAHNADDNTETILLNFVKGAGLKGLSGIPEKREKVIRPVLTLSKEEILGYLQKKKIEYRTDSSNLENDYQRNFLRNEIIPLIKKKLNPQFDAALLRTSEIMQSVSSFVNEQIQHVIEETTVRKQKKLIIDLKKLKGFDYRLHATFFRTAVKKYLKMELDGKNINDLENLLNKQTGKKVAFTNGLQAVKERNSIIIYFEKLKKDNVKQIQLSVGEKKSISDKVISVREINGTKVRLGKSRNREYITADKIKGSLTLRRWTNGDRFYPLGMKHSKKVSDFLNEQKIESNRKKEQLVLTNYEKIVWIVGIRIDERYKLTDKTKKVLELCST